MTGGGSPLANGYCSGGHWPEYPAAAVERVRAGRRRGPVCGTRHYAACPKCGTLIESDKIYDCTACDQHFPPRISLERLEPRAA